MSKLTIKADEWWSCDGEGKCGGSDFESIEDVKRRFNCEYCKTFKRDGLKLIDERVKDKTLFGW